MILIDQLINECGYGDKLHIPAANEENRTLMKEIDKKTGCKTSLTTKLENVTKRVDTLKKHALNVILVDDHNQKLLTAYSMQLDSEDNLLKLSNSTNSKLSQEIQELLKERKDISERLSLKDIELGQLRIVLESLEKIAKYDTDQLWKWEEYLHQENEDNKLIQIYIKTDSKKFKALDLRRRKLCAELANWQHSILTYVNEVFEFQNILDRIAKLYSTVLRERQQLINQWTQSVLVLNHRDREIQKAIRQIDQLQEIGREQMEFLKDSEEFFSKQVSDNKQFSECMQQLERKLVSMKSENSKMWDSIAAYSSEMHVQKKTLVNLGRQTENMRAQMMQFKIEVGNEDEKIMEWNKQIEDLKSTLQDVDNQRTNVADRMTQLECMIGAEDKFQKLIIRKIGELQGLTERTMQRIVNLETEIRSSELQIQAEEKKMESLNNYLAKDEKILNEKQEAQYHSDHQVKKCQIKLRRMTSEGYNNNLDEKKEKSLQDLQKIFHEKKDNLNLLQSQITSLEHDVKKLSTCIATDEKELVELRNKKQTKVLLIEGGEKQLNALQAFNDDGQVNENILRLRISQAEQTISNINNKVFDLEKHKLQIEATIEERKTEIKVQKESLSLSKRVVVAEVLKTRMAISERKCRICQLQTRYDNIMSCLGTTTDGSPLTVTYIKIKSAQDKFALQEQGDRLDELIRKTECEIESMENTLRIVNASNDKYKRSLGLIGKNDPEEIERGKLSEEMYIELEKMRSKRYQLNEAKSDLKLMENNWQRLLIDINEAMEEKAEKQRQLQVFQHQIKEQNYKQSRAERSLQMIYKDLQNVSEGTEDNSISRQEKDVAIRNLQEQNGLALQHITEITTRHAEVEPYIKKLLVDKNMTLPCTNYLRSLPLLSRSQSSGSFSCTKVTRTQCGRSISNIYSLATESVNSILNMEQYFHVKLHP